MLELFQFPWSPYCLVQRRILEYSGAPFKVTNIPNPDRKLIWKISKQRYYQVPVLRDGKTVVFETGGDSQVIAKYLDSKLALGLFPREWEGVQSVLWRYFENEIEDIGFRLNDIYFLEMVPASDRLGFIRHKERKFGRGCLEAWASQQSELLQELETRLQPCEQMLVAKPFLLGEKPLFADFDLFGIVENFLYSGHYHLPPAFSRLKEWHGRMKQTKLPVAQREKLHSRHQRSPS